MDDEEADDFIEKFRVQLTHADDFMQVVLNGHVDVERHLDDFLDEIFFYPSYVEKAGLSFAQKVHLARAYAELSHLGPQWNLMLALNALRNKIAHRSARKQLQVNYGDVKKGVLAMKLKGVDVEKLTPHDLVVHAVALCGGHLAILHAQLREAQGKEPLDD